MLGVSGAVKLKSTSRAGLSLSPLAIAEMVVAVGIAVVAFPGVADGSTTRWAVPGAVLLLLGSTMRHGLRLAEYRRLRADSEGGRLANYVKYMSGTDGGQDRPDSGGETGS